MPLDHGVRHDDRFGSQLKWGEELPDLIEQPFVNQDLVAAFPQVYADSVTDYGRAVHLVLIGGHCAMALGRTDGRLEVPDVRLVGVEVPPHLHEGVPTELLNHGGGPLRGPPPPPPHAN